jgi:drug/metabolite transporter (DMT)-like permease
MGLEWLVLALAAAVLNGFSTLAAKPSADRLGPWVMWFGAILLEGTAFLVAGLLWPRGPGGAGGVFVLAAVSAGILGAVGYLTFFAGMTRGTVGLVGTISATAPVLTIVLSVAFLQETLGVLQVLGIAMTVSCVLLLTVDPKHASMSRRLAVLLSLGSFLVWGLWGFLVKASVGVLGEGDLFLLLGSGYLGVSLVAAIRWRMTPAREDPVSRPTWAVGLFVFLTGSIAAIVLAAAYDVGPASVVAPVTGTYPVIATLGAWALLRERPGWRVGGALILFVVGIGLLSAA